MLDSDGGLLRGTLDVLILKALSWGPRHGYAVAEWINVITDGDLLVEEGPLYTALHRLEQNGWLTAEWGYSDNNRRAKYYQLSRAGRHAAPRRSDSSWERYARAVGKALGATAPLQRNDATNASMRRVFRLPFGAATSRAKSTMSWRSISSSARSG